MKKIIIFLLLIVAAFASKAQSIKSQNTKSVTEDCNAQAIRLSMEAGGLNTKGHPQLSKDYGPFLLKKGYKIVSNINYVPTLGDTRVFQPYPGGDVAGHIDVFTGIHWVSSYGEKNFWPNPKYKKYHPSYQIFRWSEK